MANDLFTLGLNVAATRAQMDRQLKQIAKELSDSKSVQVTAGLNVAQSQNLIQQQLSQMSKNFKLDVQVDTSTIMQQTNSLNQKIASNMKTAGVKVPFQFDLSNSNAVKTEIDKIVASITGNKGSLIKVSN